LIGIFIVGLFITLIVVAAIVILVLGHRAAQADLDQRSETAGSEKPFQG
jgi:preprotein translocase subunit SecG